MDEETLMAEMVENALEDTYGTTDSDEMVEMAENGTLDDVAFANALAEALAEEDNIDEEALAEALEEEELAACIDEEVLANVLAEELGEDFDEEEFLGE